MDKRHLQSILIHIPIGLGIMATLLVHWIAALSLLLGFLTYEVIEMIVLILDRWMNKKCLLDVHDRAYPEIAGMLIGIGIGAMIIWVLNYFGIDLHFVCR